MADELEGSTSQPLIGGLKVSVERNAFGRQIDSRYRSIEPSDAAKAADLGSDAYFIRAPIVSTLGEGVEVLATMPGDATKAAAVRQDKMLATCFHPEISSDDSWLQYFLSEVAGIASTTAVPPPKPTTVAPWHALPESGAEAGCSTSSRRWRASRPRRRCRRPSPPPLPRGTHSPSRAPRRTLPCAAPSPSSSRAASSWTSSTASRRGWRRRRARAR